MKLLTIKQVAEMLGVSVATLRYWKIAGKGPKWLAICGSIRYDMADVEAFVNASRPVSFVRETQKGTHECLQATQ